ncbi:MAG TPA: NAD(+) diphosphatase [Burkholderiaceae bacterium]|nr:NAD(+) diphosphatase [Burkholderiaceae bacterium]
MLTTPISFVSLLAAQDQPAANNFIFRGDELLVREADLALPDAAVLALLEPPNASFFPVGLLDGRYCHTTWLDKTAVPAEGFVFRKLRALFGAMDEALLAVAGRAFQIADWARTHRFCGACGTATAHVQGERCVKCPACGMVAYPRISPAMMVLIKRGDAILLARHTHSPAPFFTALAGFLEAGESIEDAVHREIFEEVGLKVRNIRYHGSQPWPFPHSLMIAFTAEYESGDILVDQTEIAEARWFGPGDEIPRIPHSISIASHLINAHLPGPT